MRTMLRREELDKISNLVFMGDMVLRYGYTSQTNETIEFVNEGIMKMIQEVDMEYWRCFKEWHDACHTMRLHMGRLGQDSSPYFWYQFISKKYDFFTLYEEVKTLIRVEENR